MDLVSISRMKEMNVRSWSLGAKGRRNGHQAKNQSERGM